MEKMIMTTDMMNTRNEEYCNLLENIKHTFTEYAQNGTKLFQTDSGNLYSLFLEAIPENERNIYNCHACRQFVNKYGGLVTVSESGRTIPVMWGEVSGYFAEAVEAVKKRVEAANIVGVFVTDKETLGTFEAGGFSHMAAAMPQELIYRGALQEPNEKMAAAKEEYRMLCENMDRYNLETAKTALKILRSSKVFQNDKLIDMAEWFYEVLKCVKPVQNLKTRTNLIWLKSATAPEGFCHIAGNMVGTVLDDILAGYSYNNICKRYNEKMNPLQYQRPQAAPTEGNVMQAEKIIEKLGLQNSLKRRFARREELKALWMPKEAAPKENPGIFSNVVTKKKIKESGFEMDDAVTMTWEKFRRTVLPEAKKIEYAVSSGKDNYAALLTATDMDAPPIIRWDTQEERNPFSWYVYHKGSYPQRWCLEPGWVNVTSVVLQPNMWSGKFDYEGSAVLFLLEGAKDSGYKDGGIALFPGILRGELREVRSTIEAFSETEVLTGYEEATACGIRLQDGCKWNAKFRVQTELGTSIYVLDRWD